MLACLRWTISKRSPRPQSDNHLQLTTPPRVLRKLSPAIIARPIGAPVYHGFQVVDGVAVDGFTFGKITDFEAEPSDYGDAFVIAPDKSRAGLVWEVSDQPYFQEVCPLEPERWGVWGVTFPYAMDSRDNVSSKWPAATSSEWAVIASRETM